MPNSRYQPRLTGAGKQFMQQALDKKLIRVIMTPFLRRVIKNKFGCTDEDIDRAIKAGETEFGNEFKEMLKKQQAEMTPPKEETDDRHA